LALLCAQYGRAVFRQLIYAVEFGLAGNAVLMVLLSSAVPLTLLAQFGEKRDITTFLDLGVMPWSLTIGDPFVLPALFAVAALQARDTAHLDPVELRPTFLRTRGYLLFSVAVGIACGIGFHLMEAAAYAEMGRMNLYFSVAKGIHDLVVMTLLVAAVVYITPGVMKVASWHRVAYALLLVAMIGLLASDAFFRTLDPVNFHVACDTRCVVTNLGTTLDWIPVDWVRDRLADLKIIR
jgi:hypothetical protein